MIWFCGSTRQRTEFRIFSYNESSANLPRKLRIKPNSNKESTMVHLQDAMANYKECENKNPHTRDLTSELWQHQTSWKRSQLAPVHSRTTNTIFLTLVRHTLAGTWDYITSVSFKPLLMIHKALNWRKIRLHIRTFLKCSGNCILPKPMRSRKSFSHKLGK